MKETKLKIPGTDRVQVFTDGSESEEDHLVILMWGDEHVGKSRLLATGPEIAGVVPTDRKSRYSVEKASKEAGVKILMPKKDFVREAIKGVRSGWLLEPKNEAEINAKTEESKGEYRKLVNEVKECAWILHDQADVNLVAVDSFSQLYEDIKYAHYGRTGHLMKRMTGNKMFKDTREADQETQDFINSLSDKHLILTHRSKPEYDKANNATGATIWSGCKTIGYLCNLQIEMVMNKKYNPDSDKDGCDWHYGLNIIKSIHKPELEGEAGKECLKDDMISLSNLINVVLG